jgi:hypothetical protein
MVLLLANDEGTGKQQFVEYQLNLAMECKPSPDLARGNNAARQT